MRDGISLNNKYGIFYAYWTKSWNISFSKLLKFVSKASELGFDVLELRPEIIMNLSDSERKKLKKKAEEEKIDFSFCTGLSEDRDISSKREKTRERGIEYLTDVIKTIHDFGSDMLSGLIYASWNPSIKGKDINKSAHLKRSVNSMTKVIDKAEALDVYCNVEAVNRFEQFSLNTSKEAINYIERVGSSNLKIHLDTFHMNIEEDDMQEAILEAGDKLGNFHIGENNRKPPGRGGHIDWDDISNGLKKINYEGNITMEPFLIPGGNIAKDVSLWRDLSKNKNLNKEVEKSLKFIKRKMN